MTPDEVAAAADIVFKSDPAWRIAVDDLRDVFAGREHVPSGPERKAARQARAARNQTSERRKR